MGPRMDLENRTCNKSGRVQVQVQLSSFKFGLGSFGFRPGLPFGFTVHFRPGSNWINHQPTHLVAPEIGLHINCLVEPQTLKEEKRTA